MFREVAVRGAKEGQPKVLMSHPITATRLQVHIIVKVVEVLSGDTFQRYLSLNSMMVVVGSGKLHLCLMLNCHEQLLFEDIVGRVLWNGNEGRARLGPGQVLDAFCVLNNTNLLDKRESFLATSEAQKFAALDSTELFHEFPQKCFARRLHLNSQRLTHLVEGRRRVAANGPLEVLPAEAPSYPLWQH